MDILHSIDEKIIPLCGKRDKLIPLCKSWPIYELDIYDKNGLWMNFKRKLNELDEKDKLKTVDIDEIDNFYYKNADIEFELHYTDDIAKRNFLFKIENNIHSYVIDRKNKRSKKLFYVRFFFDLKEFFNC
jgi:hypothetical protein